MGHDPFTMRPKRNLALKLAIVMLGKRQREIAHRAEMTDSVLSQIILGYRPPSPEQRKRLARVLGKPESELFSGTL